MSPSGDGGYGGGDYGRADSGQTRTRLPEGGDDTYGKGRRSRTGPGGRNLVTIVGVVVLLIAAIAFANRGGGDGANADAPTGTQKGAEAQPTTPTGVKPVDGKRAGIATGYAKTRQGAQSAATNYAVALGSDGMFDRDRRHEIIDTVMAPSAVPGFRERLDRAYSPEFAKNLGLKPDGTAPAGQTFVSRTIPIGTKIKEYRDGQATVEVWCTGLVGLAGTRSTNPVTTSWYTATMKLAWTDGDWKVLTHTQKDGPAPIGSDVPVSGAKEIAGAVEGFGGFTYAR
ncbi:hypothetical protein [Streptomyces sp. NPDC003077]|uniref:hypothetical protein n=1 Tax=Streptomyces sp. NPDC003077 TaxID=3154443 RepID=UPI00339EEB02